jgi:sialate O-acetylesterase
MVLQQARPLPVWGLADAGEKVEVTFAGKSQTATADAKGAWRVDLPSQSATATPATLTVRGHNTIELHDVLVGEVWFCAGQSNMQRTLAESANGDAAVAAADHPQIRLFNVNRDVAFGQKPGTLGQWELCTPQSAKPFSAVAYYFGVALQRELKVPIGLIDDSFGGTPGESWTPAPELAANPDLRPTVDRTKVWERERPRIQTEYDAAMAKWKQDVAQAKANNTMPLPRQPRMPNELRPQWIAGSIFDRMVAPIIPFAIRGAAWYQGESNEDRAQQYGVMLPVLIKSWRDRWGQGPFPFAIVQLPSYRQPTTEPTDSAWSQVRDAQFRAFKSTAHTGLISTIDIGERNNIHPKDKKDVGERLARWAMAEAYGKDVTPSGPVFREAKVEGDKVILSFDDVGQRLKVRGGNEKLAEFAIAGADRQWHWADAKIVGKDQVAGSSPQVPQPKAVRYAWNSFPRNPNLTNDTDIPAAPFRTDDWPGPTDGKR